MAASKPPFAAGDIVQLHSGGPLLTVVECTAAEVRCVYFCEPAGEFRNQGFAPALLSRIDIEDDELDDDELDD